MPPHARCPRCHRFVEVVLNRGPEPKYAEHDSHPPLRVLCSGSLREAAPGDIVGGGVDEVTEDEMAEVYRSLGVTEHSGPDYPTAIFDDRSNKPEEG